MCSASASGDTVINKSTLYVQSGLKYNNLCGKCPERVHYNTLHRVTRQQQF